MSLKKDFLFYQAQTTPYAPTLNISRAEGCYLYDDTGKSYLDFVAGVSANVLGHGNQRIIDEVKSQLDAYMHVMVYGEFIQEPALELCKLLSEHTPENLQTTYLVNSGAEAIDGAIKLSRRYTQRKQIIACKDAYHGNTYGAMSISSGFREREVYGPFLEEVDFIRFNQEKDLEAITEKTAAVVVETIQGAAGFILPENDYLKKLKKRCSEKGALLVLDEIQPGFGRTGKLFAFEHYGVSPDILVIGKAMGGGLPVGAFMSSSKIMTCLKENPMLGHITTFGGNPVIAASAQANLQFLLESQLMDQIVEKEKLFRKLLVHPLIKNINGKGLMLSVVLKEEIAAQVVQRCLDKGLIVFLLLYRKDCVRITPPITIAQGQIKQGVSTFLEALDGF